ncbi:hypothetical protein M408DRAFT_330098 [Serendipita vermifera MAFF 305830]|uniref:Extracellular membrane protein CFEM domain-containing protein n=1 Tax=Serendipita vermifera MAFF 305830 TaxID=933852 RepID=A0A0C3B7F3_SERVB|nr:hypothetical protein M408DRAFT_330098 [Serendipita vermifera MAFF 305830]
MRVISIVSLFIASVLAQGDSMSDPVECANYCKGYTYVTSPSVSDACPDFTDSSLSCLCNNAQFEATYALCLHDTCQSVQDGAAQHHRDECASAIPAGSQSSSPAPPSASETAPPPSTTTPLLSSLINGLTSTSRSTTTTRTSAGSSSSTSTRSSGGLEAISSHLAGVYAAIAASGIMMALYTN